MALKFIKLIKKGLKDPTDLLRIVFNLPKFIKLYYRLFKDRRVPFHLKLILILALAYVVSPIDLIPDWLLPFFGQLDDAIVLIAALRYFLNNCPAEVVKEHVERIERTTGDKIDIE
jgi:uncharacterized membrane protein YkvA (DUF1232 family)